jgi:hypothetical protein
MSNSVTHYPSGMLITHAEAMKPTKVPNHGNWTNGTAVSATICDPYPDLHGGTENYKNDYFGEPLYQEGGWALHKVHAEGSIFYLDHLLIHSCTDVNKCDCNPPEDLMFIKNMMNLDI